MSLKGNRPVTSVVASVATDGVDQQVYLTFYINFSFLLKLVDVCCCFLALYVTKFMQKSHQAFVYLGFSSFCADCM